MRLQKHELEELLKRPGMAERNPDLADVSNPTQHPRQTPIMEPAFIPDALGATPLQIASGQRFHVRVCSVRHRLLDEDNLSAKYVIDMLRYVGFISDDNAWLTKIEVTQKKCAIHETEHVEVVIERL